MKKLKIYENIKHEKTGIILNERTPKKEIDGR